MNAIWKSTQERRRKLRRKRRLQLLAVLLCCATLFGLYHFPPQFSDPSDLSTDVFPESESVVCPPVELAQDAVADPALVAEAEVPTESVLKHEIVQGDTLSSIFDALRLSRAAMCQILAADEEVLALDTLRPGNRLTFTLDPQSRELQKMELFVHPARWVLYTRADAASFDFEEVVLPGRWEQQLLEGEIQGSFYVSARRAGLTDQETAQVGDLFSDQIHFAREMQAGDRFQIIRSQQFVETEPTGQSRIEGVRIFRGKQLYSAFLFEDGNYYDHKGESLARAFRRYPTTGQYRVSSHFNPRRLHPITRRVSPHNGVDFAMPTGTPIVSIGDGVVTRVQNHPYAGKYVEIQHGSHYATRYLHLSRFQVKPGQRVKRGQRIAMSGNTGRSTGPHLHFELHIKGRPVNPLTASIPMASSVPRAKLALFNQRVEELVGLMEHPPTHIAQPSSPPRGDRPLTGQLSVSSAEAIPAS